MDSKLKIENRGRCLEKNFFVSISLVLHSPDSLVISGFFFFYCSDLSESMDSKLKTEKEVWRRTFSFDFFSTLFSWLFGYFLVFLLPLFWFIRIYEFIIHISKFKIDNWKQRKRFEEELFRFYFLGLSFSWLFFSLFFHLGNFGFHIENWYIGVDLKNFFK